MASVVLKSLSILLGLFFIFIGIMKLTPHISKDLHRDLVSATVSNLHSAIRGCRVIGVGLEFPAWKDM
jgi:hypothetical protein